YFEDPGFAKRVLPAPVLRDDGYPDLPAAQADDWSGRPIPPMPPGAGEDTEDRAGEGGLAHRPELDDTPDAVPPISGDAALLWSADDDEPEMAVGADSELQRAARLAALDPEDGIAL
ncbi:MAG TPA: hypothetical protein VIO38_10190, partial [Rariglobus sp.]